MINGNRNKFVYRPVARLLLTVNYNGYSKIFIVYLQVFSEPYCKLQSFCFRQKSYLIGEVGLLNMSNLPISWDQFSDLYEYTFSFHSSFFVWARSKFWSGLVKMMGASFSSSLLTYCWNIQDSGGFLFWVKSIGNDRGIICENLQVSLKGFISKREAPHQCTRD